MSETMTSKARCLAAMAGQPVDHTPVFPLLMFFAQKRALPTYREYATNGRALAEAQIKAFRTFGIDAVTSLLGMLSGWRRIWVERWPFPKTNRRTRPVPWSRPRRTSPNWAIPTPRKVRMGDRVLGTREIVNAIGDEALVLGWVDLPFAEACSLVGRPEHDGHAL